MKYINICLLFLVALFTLLPGVNIYAGGADSSYSDYSDTIKIGLLFSGSETNSSVQAAELAMARANEAGDSEGLSFKLVKRSTEGPWGVGSKQSVDFVFKDDVSAILGSVDGRNAHLAEQVAARTQTVFLSARTTDPTLSQAYVPWYFRCVPNDDQQAEAIFREIRKLRDSRFAIIGDTGYDSEKAISALLKQTRKAKHPEPGFIDNDPAETDYSFIKQISEESIPNLVLTGKASYDLKLLERVGQLNKEIHIFCTLPFIDGDDLDELLKACPEGTVMVLPGLIFTSDRPVFYPPDVTAAYAYDGINILIKAIRNVGKDREKIREFLAGENFPDGITGNIRFDEMGNRINAAELMIIRNANPEPVD